jgi:phosphoglycolate phosphatase-like HAD superfamily hydrolase
MRFGGIAWDVDGTLADSEPRHHRSAQLSRCWCPTAIRSASKPRAARTISSMAGPDTSSPEASSPASTSRCTPASSTAWCRARSATSVPGAYVQASTAMLATGEGITAISLMRAFDHCPISLDSSRACCPASEPS